MQYLPLSLPYWLPLHLQAVWKHVITVRITGILMVIIKGGI